MGDFCMKREFSFFALGALLLSVAFLLSGTQRLFSPSALAASASPSFRVVIDAGHGGIDDGAIGIGGVREKDLNLAFAQALATLFREAGADVVMTRTEDALVLKAEDENAPSRKSRDLANRLAVGVQNPDALFISIHMNSFPLEKYRGFEIYYSTNHPESRIYADAIRRAVVEKHEPYNTRALKAGGNLYLLKHLQTPAVLLECGFLSNAQDAAKLSDKDYQNQLCFSIFCAIMEVKR